MILGSGLSGVADSIDNPSTLPYAELEGFPDAKVSGHAGQLVLGELAGIPVACLQGRRHAYEGHALTDLAIPIRALKAAGCETLFITCAAGSLREEMPPGSLMMLTDHINWPGLSPLVGPNDDALGQDLPIFLTLMILPCRDNCARPPLMPVWSCTKGYIFGVLAPVSRHQPRFALLLIWALMRWGCLPCPRLWWHATVVWQWQQWP